MGSLLAVFLIFSSIQFGVRNDIFFWGEKVWIDASVSKIVTTKTVSTQGGLGMYGVMCWKAMATAAQTTCRRAKL